MKLVKIRTHAPLDRVRELIMTPELVNRGVRFDESRGRPDMLVKDKGGRLHISCRLIRDGRADNGFLEGTYFLGTIKDKGAYRAISGIILTAPVYHLILLAIMGVFVYKCIDLGGFNPIPVILLAFSLYMFKDEFRKQGIIKRYIERSVRRAEENENK